jgi:hypothetical protein
VATVPLYTFGDTANAVLNTARSRVDDLILTPIGAPAPGSDPGLQQTQVGGGTLLTELNTDGSLTLRTQVIFNSAYRKLQKYLANLGFRLLNGKVIVASLTANVNADLGAESWLSWNGYFNGTSFTSTPVLPPDLYAPLWLRERVHGSGSFTPMLDAINGLLNVPSRSILNRQWEWRNGAIYFIGASGSTDIQLSYIKYLPDLVANLYITAPWYYQPLPIPGCLSALAWYISYEVLVPRIGEANSAGTLANAQDEADKIFNDQARGDQRTKQISESLARPGSPGFPDGTGGVQPMKQ